MAVVSVTNGVLNISSQDEIQVLSQELSNVMLDNLSDVTITGVTNGEFLVYNSANAEWQNSPVSFDQALGDLTDVNLTSVADGEILVYDAATSKWINSELVVSSTLADLTDVDVTGVIDGQFLAYNDTTGKWEPTTAGAGAVDSVNGQTGVVVLDTDDISEGTTNLYYTDTRADARVAAGIAAIDYPVDSVNGQTDTVVLDTDDISEGATNLYYTDARVQAVSINAVSEDTAPSLGGNLNTNGFNIAGVGNLSMSSNNVHGLIRTTTNDNNPVLQLAKNTAGLNESVLLKSMIGFRATNSTVDHTVAHLYAERLSDANPSRQLVLGLFTDTGSRADLFRISRDSGSVDTINMLTTTNATDLNTTGTLTATGVVNINNTLNATGNVNFTGGTIDLHASVAATLESDVDVNITAGSGANINVTGKRIVSSAAFEANVDMSTLPNAILINSEVPASKDIVNHMTGYSVYTNGLPPANTIQNTYTFGVKQTGAGFDAVDVITGRLVSTYNPGTTDTQMQLRAYKVADGTHEDLVVTTAKAYSTVPFEFPSDSIATYSGPTNRGVTIFDTDTNKLQTHDGTNWQPGPAIPFPVYTETQRDALAPLRGWVIFNETTVKLQVCVIGGATPTWVDLH